MWPVRACVDWQYENTDYYLSDWLDNHVNVSDLCCSSRLYSSWTGLHWMLLSQALASCFLVMSFWARTHALNEGQHAAALSSCPTISHEVWTCFNIIKSNSAPKKWCDFDHLKLQVFFLNFILKSLWRCLWAVLQLTTKKRWRYNLTYWTINVVHEQSVSLSFSLVTTVQRLDTSLRYVTCPYFGVCTVHFSSHTGALLDASFL